MTPTIAIIGAGPSGLCTAIQLQKQLNIQSFAIFEKNEGVAGTWNDNRYPGCGCDVPSVLYSFSFELNPDWSKKFSLQPEILAYFESVARKHDIYRYIRFHTEVIFMRWDEPSNTWRVRSRDTVTNKEHEESFNYVINGVGALCRPAYPDIRGLDTFKGAAFHTNRWDNSVDLTGKNVVMIGSAASAVQVAPSIAPIVKHLTVFQRTANWVIPRDQFDYSAIAKWVFRYIPGVMALYRFLSYLQADILQVAFRNMFINKLFRQDCLNYLKRTVKDDVLRAKITPNFPVGCKRVLLSDDFIPCLTRENVSVVTESISHITEDTIVTVNGEVIKADVIIFATGFLVQEFLKPMQIIGRDGLDIHRDVWSKNGLEAYLGITIANFPNMTLLLGPGTALGHLSVLMQIESQVNYSLQLIKHSWNNGGFFDVHTDAMRKYNKDLQEQFKGTVWAASNCTSWYQDQNGLVRALWPRTVFAYAVATLEPVWSHYQMKSYKNLPVPLAQRALRGSLLLLIVAVVVLRRFAPKTFLGNLLSFLPF